MKQTSFLTSALVFFVMAKSLLGVDTIDDQVRAMARRYDQVEAQLTRSVHYLRKEVTGTDTRIDQAWFNGAGDLIKVATEHLGSSGRELTEYFAPDFDLAFDALFVLARKETPLENGGIEVAELRKYVGTISIPHKDYAAASNGELIRELRKTARFKAGEPLDTAHVPNKAVDPRKQPKVGSDYLEKPKELAEELRKAGPPHRDPTAGIKGDSEKYRAISRTASSDGRYAIALGFMGSEVNWDDYKDESFDDGSYSADAATTAGARERQTVNYLVDLGTRKILGTTGCTHFGTRSRYNHITCSVVWSPDCATFVQVTSDKWSYSECRVGRIADGPKLVGTADLGEAAEISADTFLTARKRPRHEDDGSIDLAVGKVTNDGTIHLRLWSQSPSVPNKGEVYYKLDEQFRLHTTPKGLRLETLKVRYAPKE